MACRMGLLLLAAVVACSSNMNASAHSPQPERPSNPHQTLLRALILANPDGCGGDPFFREAMFIVKIECHGHLGAIAVRFDQIRTTEVFTLDNGAGYMVVVRHSLGVPGFSWKFRIRDDAYRMVGAIKALSVPTKKAPATPSAMTN